MRSSVVDSCGDEAGVWLFTFKSLIMLPVQQHVGCTSTSSTGAPPPPPPPHLVEM